MEHQDNGRKRAKLDGSILLGNRRISAGVVRAVLEAVDADVAMTRWEIRHDLQQAAADVYGADVSMELALPMNGNVFNWSIAKPQGLLLSLIHI